jgi:hypothetical protein
MPKKENTIKEILAKNFPWFIGVLITILNIWLTYRLAPIQQGILGNTARVVALESWANKHEGYSLRLEGKIDTLLQDVASLKAVCR